MKRAAVLKEYVMNKISSALYESAQYFGILTTLKDFHFNICVRIPLSERYCNQSIDVLDLSVRANNGLRRSGVNKVGDIIDIIMSDVGLSHIRNLGKKSVSEIKTSILIYGYDELNDREKRNFWNDFIFMNNIPDNYTFNNELNA